MHFGKTHSALYYYNDKEINGLQRQKVCVKITFMDENNDKINQNEEQNTPEEQYKSEQKRKNTYTPISNKQAFLIRSTVFAILGIIILVFYLVKKYGG